jgi:hypothetical protein
VPPWAVRNASTGWRAHSSRPYSVVHLRIQFPRRPAVSSVSSTIRCSFRRHTQATGAERQIRPCEPTVEWARENADAASPVVTDRSRSVSDLTVSLEFLHPEHGGTVDNLNCASTVQSLSNPLDGT